MILDVMLPGAARLELLVRDVIDLARLGAHEFSLDRRTVSLGPTLDEALAVADALRLRQIASNLIDNALRVPPPGFGLPHGPDDAAT